MCAVLRQTWVLSFGIESDERTRALGKLTAGVPRHALARHHVWHDVKYGRGVRDGRSTIDTAIRQLV